MSVTPLTFHRPDGEECIVIAEQITDVAPSEQGGGALHHNTTIYKTSGFREVRESVAEVRAAIKAANA
jgi:hypothetical protein